MSALGLLALPLVPLVAAEVGTLCDGAHRPTVGQWANYQTDVPLLKTKMESRYAIVASEGTDDQLSYWLEMDIQMPMGKMTLQFLVPGYPYETVLGVVMKMAEGVPAMVYPPAMAASLKGNDNLSEPLRMACEASASGVQESITVPAGTFSALRISLRSLGKDIWISPEVPFGVVKMAEADGKGLELLAYGMDAVSSITEEPQKMPGFN